MESPSIDASLLAADWCQLGPSAARVLEAGADRLHLDVMDHHYVPNLTFGPELCRSLRRFGIKAPLDVHLMVCPAEPLVESFATTGATGLWIHPDSVTHLHRTLSHIRALGLEAGLVLNPSVGLDVLDYIGDLLDVVLVMTVNPGFGGQSFLKGQVAKIERLAEKKAEMQSSFRIAVDGGINPETAHWALQAGAEELIIGQALFKAKEPKALIRACRYPYEVGRMATS